MRVSCRAYFRPLRMFFVGVLMAMALGGCPQPSYEVLLPGVSLEQIKAIAQDDTMTDEEKIQALKDLGIEDDLLIEVILTMPW